MERLNDKYEKCNQYDDAVLQLETQRVVSPQLLFLPFLTDLSLPLQKLLLTPILCLQRRHSL
ncbi:hypothetical protein E2C01_078540 [Portunus trituberculatus]|uniref:Uncharacterized protein n=1 Tax=Portunus trituberculatus TaxID=210409 RepID=A0A5B7IEJ9_PORTR|nr:hypothetical protein [Portunus trituberculatus]